MTFSEVKKDDCLLITYTYLDKLERTNYFIVDEIIANANNDETVFVGRLRSGLEYVPYRVFVSNNDMENSKFVIYNNNLPDSFYTISTTNLRNKFVSIK